MWEIRLAVKYVASGTKSNRGCVIEDNHQIILNPHVFTLDHACSGFFVKALDVT